jgi:hypothetical protein
MGKQRIPQGQRSGRRMPVRRPPAEATGNAAPAEMPAGSVTAGGSALDPTAHDREAVPVEAEAGMLEATPVAAEVGASEASSATGPEEGVADAEAVSELEAASEESTASTEAEEASPEIVAAEQAAPDTAPDEVPAVNAVLPDPLLPVAALEAAKSPAASAEPRPGRAAYRFVFAPVRVDIEGISVTLANYVHNESVAALSYMRALSAARSPADMIRVNVSAMQRAADASLTCWSDIARRAARGVPLH